MGATLEVIKHERMINRLMPFVDIEKHLSQKLIFYTLYMISKLKKLEHMI